EARLALPRQAQHRALARADGNRDLEAAIAVEREPPLAAMQKVFDGDGKLGFDVRAGHVEADAAAAAARSPPGSRDATEHLREEVAEAAEIAEVAEVLRRRLAPSRRRREILALVVIRAKAVVARALLGVAQDFVGLVDLLEALRGLGALIGRL